MLSLSSQGICGYAGKTGLLTAVAHALSQHVMCSTHIVWVKCGKIETETLGKAKAHLLPLVILLPSQQDTTAWESAIACLPANTSDGPL